MARRHVQPKGMIWIFWTWPVFPGVLFRHQRSGYFLDPAGQQGNSVRDARPRLLFRFYWQRSVRAVLFHAGNTLWKYALPSFPFFRIMIAVGLLVWNHSMVLKGSEWRGRNVRCC